MRETLSRREALKQLLLATGAVAAAGTAMADPVHITLDDPTARALGYVMNASTIDPKKETDYQPGSHCANCLQLQGSPGAQWRPCNLFPGKLVNADGWCRVWVPKS